MALPEDFNKIYGSTATGGLTPINDVNYAKGWEFVGSNPPTKNDFSYLQNLSDLKAQWLYSNKLQRTDPFGDIKADGAAAIATALSNLGLKSAAKRDVGTGENQIPDMSSFSLAGDETAGAMRFPNGFKLVWGNFSLAVGGGASQIVTFYSAFSTACVAVIPAVYAGASQMIGFSAVTLTNAVLSKGNLDSDARTGKYIALGY